MLIHTDLKSAWALCECGQNIHSKHRVRAQPSRSIILRVNCAFFFLLLLLSSTSHARPFIMSAATWPELSSNHALLRLHSRLATILKEAEHDQIWQVTLSSASPPAFSTLLVLQKYLRSTSNDVDKAAEALTKTLKWRKDFGLDKGAPLSDANAPEFDGLGFVTVIGEGETKKVVTWNVYGSAAAKGLDKVFGDLEK